MNVFPCYFISISVLTFDIFPWHVWYKLNFKIFTVFIVTSKYKIVIVNFLYTSYFPLLLIESSAMSWYKFVCIEEKKLNSEFHISMFAYLLHSCYIVFPFNNHLLWKHLNTTATIRFLKSIILKLQNVSSN